MTPSWDLRFLLLWYLHQVAHNCFGQKNWSRANSTSTTLLLSPKKQRYFVLLHHWNKRFELILFKPWCLYSREQFMHQPSWHHGSHPPRPTVKPTPSTRVHLLSTSRIYTSRRSWSLWKSHWVYLPFARWQWCFLHRTRRIRDWSRVLPRLIVWIALRSLLIAIRRGIWMICLRDWLCELLRNIWSN